MAITGMIEPNCKRTIKLVSLTTFKTKEPNFFARASAFNVTSPAHGAAFHGTIPSVWLVDTS